MLQEKKTSAKYSFFAYFNGLAEKTSFHERGNEVLKTPVVKKFEDHANMNRLTA